jgi:hypothetical protein
MRNLIRRLLARPLLTEAERAHEFNRLSEDDCTHLVAYFADRHPAEFDAGLAAFGRYLHGLEEVTH